MVWQVSRVVTGHCHKGRSIGLSDGPALSIAEMALIPGLALTDLWEAVVLRDNQDERAASIKMRIGVC